MGGRLVDPPPALELADLSELVRDLHREVRELRKEVVDLRRENFGLRKEVGHWKSMHARAADRASALEAEVERLRGENRQLQDQLFGRKSEKPLPGIAPIASMATRTSRPLPGRPGVVSGTIGPVRNDAIIPTCRSSRNSASCPKIGAVAPGVGPSW
jgi:FtsZ-binding cell division protein ZapB